ncbi:MAG: hypothetical protein ACLR76_10260 [Alistipes sp.]
MISSIPAVVKNTNEAYLMTTPTRKPARSTFWDSPTRTPRRQIEIKVVKAGYEPQVKRFNVRQAIDQQEISSFFMLVPKKANRALPICANADRTVV